MATRCSQAPKGAVAAIVRQPVEGPDEGVLGQVLGLGGVARHPVGQTEDAVDVRVVEPPFGRCVPGQDCWTRFRSSKFISVIT